MYLSPHHERNEEKVVKIRVCIPDDDADNTPIKILSVESHWPIRHRVVRRGGRFFRFPFAEAWWTRRQVRWSESLLGLCNDCNGAREFRVAV